MKITRFIFCILTPLLISAVSITAQEATKPYTADPSPETLPEYVVQVRRSDGCQVAPISLKHKSGFVLYALPRPAKIQPDSSGQPITSKVFVAARQLGTQWEVKVSIGKGEFYDAGDTMVGEFLLNLNQLANVNEVTRFGLSPIQVGVLRIIRQQAGYPGFRNSAQSVSLESIEANNLPDPYKLLLRNNSQTDLIAIQYNTFREGRFLELKWLSHGLSDPLIKAGESYKLAVSSEDKSCGDADGYHPNQSDRLDLVSAVFADGSFEGQSGLAALIKGAAFGNRLRLERVVQALRNAGDVPTEIESQVKYLKDSINEETEPYMIETLRTILPPLPPDATPVLEGFIRSGMHDVKVNLIRDADRFESLKRAGNLRLIETWSALTKAKYERWLAGAENMTSH
jgi:hypothetical protein